MGRKERDDSASRATTPDVTSNAGDEGAAVDGMAIDAPGTGTVTPAGEESNSTQTKLPDTGSRWFEHPTDGNEIGTRKVDPVTPAGEGVYVLTRTDDRSTHLAYMLTIPSNIGDVQEELGLRERGSFVISVKNPERPGPASTRLPEGPGFPKEYGS